MPTVPPPDAISVLRDTAARLVSARESLEYGDVNEAAAILYDLEIDLAGALHRIGDDVVRVRLSDFNHIPAGPEE
jgi:hypothetical protein